MIGIDFISFSDMIIIIGKANEKDIKPPWSHHIIPGISILTIIIDTKKYCKNADMIGRFAIFWIIIGSISIMPAITPMIIDIRSVLMVILL